MRANPDSRDSDVVHPNGDSALRREAFSRTIAAGVSWMVLNTVISRVGGLAAQIALAYLLAPEDFGVYAIALSFATLARMIQDGGVQQLLTHRGLDEFDHLSGPAFWMALAINLGLAGLLASLAPLAVGIYDEPRLLAMLLVIAAAMPLRSPATILMTRLSMELRFRTVATIQATSALCRYGGWIVMALLGFGPLSFVLPLPFVALLEAVWSFAVTRERVWRGGLQVKRWRSMAQASFWILAGSVSTGIIQNGDYMVLGLLMAAGQVGVYYFAYELVAQLGVLVATNVNKVLFPALVELRGHLADQRFHTLRALRLLALGGTVLGTMLAVGIQPVADLAGWERRFPGLTYCVQVLGLLFPLRLLLVVTRSALMAEGRFRPLAFILAGHGAGLLAVVALVALREPALWVLAAAVGTYHGVTCLASCIYAVRSLSVSTRDTLGAVMAPWVSIGATAVLVLVASRPLGEEPGTVAHLLTVLPAQALLAGTAAWIFCRPHLRDVSLRMGAAGNSPVPGGSPREA